ncbi:hypothetical protein N2152v2_011089 [Parachlorella kessleri]
MALAHQHVQAFTQAKVSTKKLCRVSAAKKAVVRRSVRAPVKTMAVQTLEEVKNSMFADNQLQLLRPGVDDPDSIRARFHKMIRNAQNSICAAVEEMDGSGQKFRRDEWVRAGGGGGVTAVMQVGAAAEERRRGEEGKVWEKAGIAVSAVYGTMPGDAYRAAIGRDVPVDADDRVPFFVTGISCVMHPWNPHCPTMHFNYRLFETFDFKGIPGQWWFGGGTDITPCYVDEEDMKHFHSTYKAVCDRHDPEFYPKFKQWCDEYFTIRHRGEMRGLGGIFFDDLNDRDPEKIFAFATDCANHVVEAYLPIIARHKEQPYSVKEKEWQQIRRGKYAEYNVIYDRGTIFGLQTGGRTESILMSLPLTASWQYDHEPAPGTPEAEFMDACRHPRNWI